MVLPYSYMTIWYLLLLRMFSTGSLSTFISISNSGHRKTRSANLIIFLKVSCSMTTRQKMSKCRVNFMISLFSNWRSQSEKTDHFAIWLNSLKRHPRKVKVKKRFLTLKLIFKIWIIESAFSKSRQADYHNSLNKLQKNLQKDKSLSRTRLKVWFNQENTARGRATRQIRM